MSLGFMKRHVIAGLLFIFTIVKIRRPNKRLSDKNPPRANWYEQILLSYFFLIFFKGNGVGCPLFLLFTSTIYSP